VLQLLVTAKVNVKAVIIVIKGFATPAPLGVTGRYRGNQAPNVVGYAAVATSVARPALVQPKIYAATLGKNSLSLLIKSVTKHLWHLADITVLKARNIRFLRLSGITPTKMIRLLQEAVSTLALLEVSGI